MAATSAVELKGAASGTRNPISLSAARSPVCLGARVRAGARAREPTAYAFATARTKTAAARRRDGMSVIAKPSIAAIAAGALGQTLCADRALIDLCASLRRLEREDVRLTSPIEGRSSSRQDSAGDTRVRLPERG
mmetsp:Transcript_36911/g.112936  ORF Transcript_36911/g.112936 Transcript_36911/m.112936 type:complete len:135 (-) Transcript_36911:123-527(-)